MFISDPGLSDPGSRILDLGPRISDPRSRIPDPGSKKSNERQGWKKLVVKPFFGAIKFTKLNYFIFEMLKTKIWDNFQRIIELCTQKFVTKLSKIWVWDPGSRNQKGTGSRIRNTAYGSGDMIRIRSDHQISDPEPVFQNMFRILMRWMVKMNWKRKGLLKSFCSKQENKSICRTGTVHNWLNNINIDRTPILTWYWFI